MAVSSHNVLALLAVFACACAEKPFNITSLVVPEYVDPSQFSGVDLECRYDADFTVLKWWKGRQEFFRYSPGAVPSTRSFPALGVGAVEVLACGPTSCRLRLKGLTEEASGAYRCDIERERPPYKFAARTSHMRVRGGSGRRPALDGLREEYGPGEVINGRCIGAPGSLLRWYVNGQEMARNTSELRLEASRLLFLGSHAEVVVQCAEFSIEGRLLGSSAAKALWRDTRFLPAEPGDRPAVASSKPEEQCTTDTASSTGVTLVIFCLVIAVRGLIM